MEKNITISEFRNYIDEYWVFYYRSKKEILEFSKKHIPLSGFLLVSIPRRMHSILTAIFDMCETENFYALNILYRTYIEHGLKHYYIFMRLIEENNDNVGNEYYVHNMLHELQLINRAEIKAKRLAGEKNSQHNMEERLVDKFKFRDVIEYLNTKIPAKNANELPLSLISIYSRLSSFVHCGFSAEYEEFSIAGLNSKVFMEVASLSFLMFTWSFWQIYIAYDNFYRKHMGEVNQIFSEGNQLFSNYYHEIKSKLGC